MTHNISMYRLELHPHLGSGNVKVYFLAKSKPVSKLEIWFRVFRKKWQKFKYVRKVSTHTTGNEVYRVALILLEVAP